MAAVSLFWNNSMAAVTRHVIILWFFPFFTALASIVMVFGKMFFGFILGNIASTLANAEIRRVKYEDKLGAIQVCYVI